MRISGYYIPFFLKENSLEPAMQRIVALKTINPILPEIGNTRLSLELDQFNSRGYNKPQIIKISTAVLVLGVILMPLPALLLTICKVAVVALIANIIYNFHMNADYQKLLEAYDARIKHEFINAGRPDNYEEIIAAMQKCGTISERQESDLITLFRELIAPQVRKPRIRKILKISKPAVAVAAH